MRAGIVVLDMTISASENLARILSKKTPEINPTESCYCYTLAREGNLDGVINYGLGWWMAEAERLQVENLRLKEDAKGYAGRS